MGNLPQYVKDNNGFLLCNCNNKESNVHEMNTREIQQQDQLEKERFKSGFEKRKSEYEKNINSIIKVQYFIKRLLGKIKFKKKLQTMMTLEDSEIKVNIIDKMSTENLKAALKMVRKIPFNINKYKEPEFASKLNSYPQVNQLIQKMTIKGKEKMKTFSQAALLSKDQTILYSGKVNINLNKNGYGCVWMSTGEYYEGNWIDDRFDGYGRYINPAGDVIEGNCIYK